MTVPATVASIREHVRQAVLLALADAGCTAVPTLADLSDYSDATSYPLAKAWWDNGPEAMERYMGGNGIATAQMSVAVVPWCDDSDFEEKCSGIVDAVRPYVGAAHVRSCMDASMAGNLVDIVANAQSQPTGVSSPYGESIFSLAVRYRTTDEVMP